MRWVSHCPDYFLDRVLSYVVKQQYHLIRTEQNPSGRAILKAPADQLIIP